MLQDAEEGRRRAAPESHLNRRRRGVRPLPTKRRSKQQRDKKGDLEEGHVRKVDAAG